MWWCLFSLTAFKILFLSSAFSSFIIICVSVVSLIFILLKDYWTSWMCILFLNKFGKFLSIMFSNSLSTPFFSLLLGPPPPPLYVYWCTWWCLTCLWGSVHFLKNSFLFLFIRQYNNNWSTLKLMSISSLCSNGLLRLSSEVFI